MGLFKTKKKEKAGASDDAASDEAASDIQEAPSHADYKTPKDKKRNKFTFMKAKARKGSSTPADSNNDSTTPRTEASGSTPSSSPSKSISEDELEQEDAGEQDTSTPKKDLLDDLNVVDAYEEEDGGGMELVLGDIPIPSEATEPQTVAEVLIEKTVDRISAELETVDGPDDETSDTEIPEMTKLVQEKLNAVEGKERLISQIKSFDSNDRPQVYEDDSDSDSLADQQAPTPHTTTTATTAEVAAVTPVTPKRSSLPQPDLVTPVGSPNTVLADADEEEERDDANLDRNSTPQAVSKKLLQAFNCTGDMLPEQFQKPIANIRSCATDYTVMSTTVTKVVPKREPIYNDQFAVDFLDVRSQHACVFYPLCVPSPECFISPTFVPFYLVGNVKCWICLGLPSATHRGTSRLAGSQRHHVVATRNLQCKRDDVTPVGMVHHGWWHGATSRNQVGTLVEDSFRHQFSYERQTQTRARRQ
jgi:hypothetical protein